MAYRSLVLSLVAVPALISLVSARVVGPIAQLFSWNHVSVASECEEFLGPNGYGYVQVSPPQEHIQGDQWYTAYQPVSYKIASNRGIREEFKNMVDRCKDAGILVIVDAVMNHMTNHDDNQASYSRGTGGSKYSHYWYEKLWDEDDFHNEYLPPTGIDYRNRRQVQWGGLYNMADLATEKPKVQKRLAEYGRDLLSLGVAGLRVDAAKHIPATDLAQIVKLIQEFGKPYITLEVIYHNGEPIKPEEYQDLGHVQEFGYSQALRDAFLDGKIESLLDVTQNGWLPSDHVNVFVTNHDTERGPGYESLTYTSPRRAYLLATVWLLSYPYGYPTVYSGYQFAHTELGKDAGPPNRGHGACAPGSGWNCEHRQTGVVGMVGFYNEVLGEKMHGVTTLGGNRVAFSRGSKGFVAINNMATPWTLEVDTTLPDGSYCDVVDGKLGSDKSCSGHSVLVYKGSFQLTVGAYSALAIHTAARQEIHSHSAIAKFCENRGTAWGEDLYVTGSLEELGFDDPEHAVRLSPAYYPWWQKKIYLPENTQFTYRYITMDPQGQIHDPEKAVARIGFSGSGWADEQCGDFEQHAT